MKIPPTGYLMLASPCGEPVCFIVWAFAEIFLALLVGIGSVVAAMPWEN
jgi:hypothetical protein